MCFFACAYVYLYRYSCVSECLRVHMSEPVCSGCLCPHVHMHMCVCLCVHVSRGSFSSADTDQAGGGVGGLTAQGEGVSVQGQSCVPRREYNHVTPPTVQGQRVFYPILVTQVNCLLRESSGSLRVPLRPFSSSDDGHPLTRPGSPRLIVAGSSLPPRDWGRAKAL